MLVMSIYFACCLNPQYVIILLSVARGEREREGQTFAGLCVHHNFSLCYHNLNNLTGKLRSFWTFSHICERETQCRSQIGFNNTLDGHIYTLSNDTGWSKELQMSETNDKGKILKFYQKLHNICIHHGTMRQNWWTHFMPSSATRIQQ